MGDSCSHIQYGIWVLLPRAWSPFSVSFHVNGLPSQPAVQAGQPPSPAARSPPAVYASAFFLFSSPVVGAGLARAQTCAPGWPPAEPLRSMEATSHTGLLKLK